ncbi:protein of unknown function [Candidatus Hydrogenisulfobacillus filiaventi]|uniref:Uncharacterized protein n=1 Tax=Candidatus Hydrogenisulfobacillus filiaventi TaxID=2707344 RepID=A0A6F8ZCL6_9FIRM|nr:protein of unknown function [Candidatus Hydrogenisulfobacillus filiaventi]
MRRLLAQQLREAECAALYGRPRATPLSGPGLMKALRWGVAQDFSDRHLEQACRYGFRAEGLPDLLVDERRLDGTTFSAFRKRLLMDDHARAAFGAMKQADRSPTPRRRSPFTNGSRRSGWTLAPSSGIRWRPPPIASWEVRGRNWHGTGHKDTMVEDHMPWRAAP